MRITVRKLVQAYFGFLKGFWALIKFEDFVSRLMLKIFRREMWKKKVESFERIASPKIPKHIFPRENEFAIYVLH